MAEEWWTSPSEAGRRLDAVTKLWNDVQNAALGRGTKPNVSAALVDFVVAESAAFHEWRVEVEGWQFGVQWADELADWTARANKARALVKAELDAKGRTDVTLPAVVTEWHETAPATVAKIFTGAAGLALGLGAIALVMVLKRR